MTRSATTDASQSWGSTARLNLVARCTRSVRGMGRYHCCSDGGKMKPERIAGVVGTRAVIGMIGCIGHITGGKER